MKGVPLADLAETNLSEADRAELGGSTKGRARKRCYFVLSLLLLCVVAGLVIYTSIHLIKGWKTCSTKECVTSANRLKERLEEDANPCLDFYEFACGKFIRNYVGDDGNRNGITESPLENYLKVIDNYLKKPKTKEDNKTTTLMKNVYASCLDQSGREHEAIPTIRGLMTSEGVGSWPLMAKAAWIEEDLILSKRLAMLILYKVEPFFRFVLHQGNSSQANYLEILPGYLFSPDYRFYTNQSLPGAQEFLDAYRKLVRASLRHLHIYKRDSFDDILLFEANLAQIMEDAFEFEALPYEVTMSEMSIIYPFINWRELFDELFFEKAKSGFPHRDITVFKIVINNNKYMQDLMMALENENARTIGNYLSWRFFAHMMPYMDEYLKDIYSEYLNEMEEYIPAERRRDFPATYDLHWKDCASFVSQWFVEPISNLIVNRTMTKEHEVELRNSFGMLKTALKKAIPNQLWLDEALQKSLIKRVEDMTLQIGRLPIFSDTDYVKAKYDNLEIEGGEPFVYDVLEIWRNDFKQRMKGLGTRSEIPNWPMSPLDVKALVEYNRVALSFGILEAPFFQMDRPKYFNYAGLIGEIARELGRQLVSEEIEVAGTSGDPVFRHSVKMEYALVDSEQCFSAQHSALLRKFLGVKEEFIPSLRNIMADNMGLQLAYKAYMEYKEQVGEKLRIPDLDYTDEKLFFIAYTQMFCEPEKEDDSKDLAMVFYNSGRYRSIGSIINSRSFGKEFKCQGGTPMNPVNKCQFWDIS